MNKRHFPAAQTNVASCFRQRRSLGAVLGLLWIAVQLTPLPVARAAEPALPETVEQIEAALRRGLFSQAVAGGRRLLTKTPSAPVNGMVAVGLAATGDLTDAGTRIRIAEQEKEPNVKFYALLAEAHTQRVARRFDAAAATCGRAIQESANHPLGHILLSQIRFEQKDYEASILAATTALRLEPKMSLAHTAIGMARLSQGKPQEAIRAFNDAIPLDPTDLRPRIGLAESLVRLKAWGQAIAVCRKILELNAESATAQELLAVALLETGQPREALGAATAAVQSRPNSIPASMSVSRALAQTNDLRGAIKRLQHVLTLKPGDSQVLYTIGVYQLALDDQAAARSSLDSAMAASAHPATSAALGVIEHLAGKSSAARDLFTRAAADANGEMKERMQFHLGIVRLSEKEWSGAKSALALAQGFFPNSRMEKLDLAKLYSGASVHATALINLGVLCLVEGLPDAAIRAFGQSAKEAPSNPVALILLSNTQARVGKYDDALAALNQLTKIAPQYAPAYFGLGEIHTSRQSQVEAMAAFTKAVELDGDFGLAYLRLGVLHSMNGDVATAATMYRQAIRLLPESVLAYNELANILAEKRENLPEALALAQKANELGPNNGLLLDTLGWVQYKSAQYAAAVATFQRALQAPLNPEVVPTVRYHLGLAHMKAGNPAKALPELQAALDLAPTGPDAAEIKKLIGQLRGL